MADFSTTETRPSILADTNAQVVNTRVNSLNYQDLVDQDREIYGTRFNTIAGEHRLSDDTSIHSLRSYRLLTNWQVPAWGILTTVPTPLPGSANKLVGSGSTIADRGGLGVFVRGRNCTVQFGMRVVVLDGLGGFSSVGSFSTASLSLTNTTGWQDGESEFLYPTGIEPGDLLEIYCAVRRNNPNFSSFLADWLIIEKNLTTAAPA